MMRPVLRVWGERLFHAQNSLILGFRISQGLSRNMLKGTGGLGA